MSETLPAQTQRFQEKREAILSAAANLFNQHGVKGATLADIASSVGLVTNSVTYYYRKKEDLASACFLRAIDVFRNVIEKAAQQGSVEARVHEFFRLHSVLLADIDRGTHAPMMQFNDMRALPSPHFEQVSDAYNEMFRRLRELLRTPQTAQLGRADLAARTYTVLSVAHWLRGWIDRYETDEYAHIAEQVSDIVIHGTASASSVWSAPSQAELGWRLTSDEDATSEAFLRAASLLVNEQGYRGASVDMISAQLNVTKGSFYHHNDNKEDLISACFERTFTVIRRALSQADAIESKGWDRACAISRSLARFQLSPEGPLLRLGATSALSDPERRAEVRRTMSRLTERLAGVVVDGMMDGSIRPLHPVMAAQIASGLVNSAASVQHWVPGATQDNVAEVYVRPIFLGILCPPSNTP
ncbi:MAG: TetR/AcrR family transcriptional regulator [Cytophagales bacterium]|nr:TetR/AcrR family transcriptional regulator [Rhizobacter sp.]